jgi:hypothetical protein
MNPNEINDKRIQKEFAGMSFSQYKKTDVKKQLHRSILDGRLEQSNYWAAELICAGHYLDLWEIIITITSKHIHYGNPKLPIYIEMRFDNFKEIVANGYIDNEIKLRNNGKVRKLFCEILCILCFSQKKNSYNPVKITKNDFDITEIKYRLKAEKLSYIQPTHMGGDPKECFIAANELAYCVSTDGQISNDACYWIEWIFEYESLCKKKKEKCLCERRSIMPVNSKYQMDIVWIIWDILLHESTKRDTLTRKIIKSLLNIFCIRYTNGVKKRRRYLIYFAVSLLTEKVNLNISLNKQPALIQSIEEKIDNIYKELKKNEIKPDTDYLYHGMKQSSIEKTIAKLDKINSIGFIPRG